LKKPSSALLARMHIPSDHDHIGAGVRRLERRELEVEIAQDVQSHTGIESGVERLFEGNLAAAGGCLSAPARLASPRLAS
jgi:hypothetical protein